MARREGYARAIGPDRKSSWESATCTCAHCNRVVHLHDPKTGKARDNILVRCHQCDQNMCVPCAEQMRCTPFEKKLEILERRDRLFRSLGGGQGEP